MTLLAVTGLEAGYGATQVLFGVSLTIAAGEAVALLGRNGMGKTTSIRSICGSLMPTAGTILFDGIDATATPDFLRARLGIGLVPEGRQVFPTLTVRENLVVAERARDAGWTLDRVYRLFPRLSERAGKLAGTLSGGEQQMLAIGRALMTNPRLLILDEATEGVAPLVRQEIWHCIAALRDQGLAILLIDKNLDAVRQFADRFYVLLKGKVVAEGPTADLSADRLHEHLAL